MQNVSEKKIVQNNMFITSLKDVQGVPKVMDHYLLLGHFHELHLIEQIFQLPPRLY